MAAVACMPRFVKGLLCSLDFMDFGCACGTSPKFPSIPNAHKICRARGAGHYGYPPKSLPHCTGDLTPQNSAFSSVGCSLRRAMSILDLQWFALICIILLIPIYFIDGTLDLGSCDGQHTNWTRRWVTRVKQQVPSQKVVGLDFLLSPSLCNKCRGARGCQCTTLGQASVGQAWCK